MTLTPKGEWNREQQLRLWPGVVAVTLQWLLWFVVPIVVPGAAIFGILGGVFGGLVVLVWFGRRPPSNIYWLKPAANP